MTDLKSSCPYGDYQLRKAWERGPKAAQAGEQQTAQVDVSDLPNGTYFVRLRANGQTRTRRLTALR